MKLEELDENAITCLNDHFTEALNEKPDDAANDRDRARLALDYLQARGIYSDKGPTAK